MTDMLLLLAAGPFLLPLIFSLFEALQRALDRMAR